MQSLNKWMGIGNLGKDPVIKQSSSGNQICSFSLATSESYIAKSGERVTKTEWHNIVVFPESLVKLANLYLKKGSKIYLEGAVQTRKYTDKQGFERYTTEIVLGNFNSKLILLDKSQGHDSQDSDNDSDAKEPTSLSPLDSIFGTTDTNDSIPF